MNIPDFLEIIGVAGLGLLAISACLMGLLNGTTPSKIKNQGFYCLGAFLIFVFIMADIILDARSARKALKQ